MDIETLSELILAMSGGMTIVSSIAGACWWLVRTGTRIEQRLAALEHSLHELAAVTLPNGGRSIHDRVLAMAVAMGVENDAAVPPAGRARRQRSGQR